MGVQEIADKAVLDVAVQPVDTLTVAGSVKGAGSLLAVLHNGANSLVTLRYRLRTRAHLSTQDDFANESDTQRLRGIDRTVARTSFRFIATRGAPPKRHY